MSIFRVVNNLFRFNRTNWKAVSLCFLAATVFWFFNALNKNYSANVRFPLKFEYDEHKFVSAQALPNNVYVNVSGNGWDLLRQDLGWKLPAVVIPLERPSEVRKIVGSTLPPLLATQVGNLKVNHIVTDTLYLSIEPKDSVRMKVVIDAAGITFTEGYGRTSPIVILPDSIQVEGPRSLIAPLAHASIMMSLPEKKVNSNYREKMDVVAPEGESIVRKPTLLEVMFEVGEVTDVEQLVKITLVNIPFASHVLKDKDSVLCKIQIPTSRRDDFNQLLSGVKAEIDLADARSGGRKMLPSFVGLPAYATLVSADSIRLRIY